MPYLFASPPFKRGPKGRPKLSPAARKRRDKLAQIASKVRISVTNGEAYFMVTATWKVVDLFHEFSGMDGAKAALDSSCLPTGAAVVRICDGVELARLSGAGTYFSK